MSEPDEQTGPSWVVGALESAFDKEWRELTSRREHYLDVKDSVLIVAEAMDALQRSAEDSIRRSNDPSRRSQHIRKKDLILAVQTSVTNTLQSIMQPKSAPTDKDANRLAPKKIQELKNRWRGAECVAQRVDVEHLGEAIRNGLSYVEKVLGIVDPQRSQPMSEDTRLLALLQDLLAARALENLEIALETINRLGLYLKSREIEVVDYNPQDRSDVDDYFDFDNEADRSAGGGYMTAPALVQANSRRVLQRGRVGTTNFDQMDRVSGDTSN